jgi:hypothetical protein
LVFAFYVVVFYVLVFGLMPWSWSHVLVLMEGAAKKSIQDKARTRQDKTRHKTTLLAESFILIWRNNLLK